MVRKLHLGWIVQCNQVPPFAFDLNYTIEACAKKDLRIKQLVKNNMAVLVLCVFFVLFCFLLFWGSTKLKCVPMIKIRLIININLKPEWLPKVLRKRIHDTNNVLLFSLKICTFKLRLVLTTSAYIITFSISIATPKYVLI